MIHRINSPCVIQRFLHSHLTHPESAIPHFNNLKCMDGILQRELQKVRNSATELRDIQRHGANQLATMRIIPRSNAVDFGSHLQAPAMGNRRKGKLGDGGIGSRGVDDTLVSETVRWQVGE